MTLTRKTEYALRALAEIAADPAGKPVSRRVIAQRQNISENFLEQIFLPLQRSGIIKSVRGPGGGFILLQVPANITVRAVKESVDGNAKYIDHCDDNSDKRCDHLTRCKIKFVWQEIDTAMLDTMESITLADILTK